jgi:hypothetical protein
MANKFNHERYRITCCKDCPDRYPGCHGKCEKYIKQRSEYDAEKAETMEKYKVACGLYEMKCNSVYKALNRRRYADRNK